MTFRGLLHTLTRRARGFARSRRGNVAMMFGLSAVTIIGAVGLAIDGGRAYQVHNRLSRSLDAAGLAAARVALTPVQAEADARRFFDANFPDGYLGSEITSFTYDLDSTTNEVTVTATAEMPTLLMRVFGIDSVDVVENAVIERQNRGLEVALAMDNTGSMRSNNMIGAMRNAATDLVDILFDGRESSTVLWISLVPYAAMVNIGPSRTGWLALTDRARTSSTAFAPTVWKGCVMARTGGKDETDDPPSVAAFESMFWAPATDNAWDSANAATIDERNDAQNNGRGPNLGCGPAITPLINVRATINTAISQMQPWHRGGTTSNLGMVWAWRTISPRWQGLWGGSTPATMPLAYENPLMDKAVVLLTDGDNQFFDWPDNGAGPRGSDFTAYGRLHDLGYTSLAAGKTELDSRLARTCAAMKAQGIIIYTITFGATPNAATQTLYRTCASDPANYFHAPTNAALAPVFRQIGERLSNLRVVR